MGSAGDPIASFARLCGAPDGSLLAHVDGDCIFLRNGDTLAVVGEVGIDRSAIALDVALLGEPLRLLVVAQHETETRIHAIDPRGPSSLGEIAVRGAVRLAGVVADYAWLNGPAGAGIIDLGRTELSMTPVPLRTPISAVGSYGTTRFAVSTGGAIEEWDPGQRIPVRRFRLGKPTVARLIGGSARQVWLVTTADATQVEIIPLLNHGQPPRIAVPDPIAWVVPAPGQESLLAITEAGASWVVDPSGRTPVAPLTEQPIDAAAWLPDAHAIAVALRDGGLEIVPLAGRARAAATERVAPTPKPPRAAPARDDDAAPAWRDVLVDWFRAGAGDRAPTLDRGPLVDLVARIGLEPALAPALTYLYAAHLCGHDGGAQADLARVLGRSWDEALGRGALAATGLVRWRGARVGLARSVVQLLDGRAPRFGELVESSAAAPRGLVAVIAHDDELGGLAAWLAPQQGPLLAANARGNAAPDRFFLEARLRGATPLVVWPTDAALPAVAVLVVASAEEARRAGATVVASWPPR